MGSANERRRYIITSPLIGGASTQNDNKVNENKVSYLLQWRHNGLDRVSNHQSHHCLLSRLFGRRTKKTSKLRATGLCEGKSPGTGELPSQMASNAENVSIWIRYETIKNYKKSCCPLRQTYKPTIILN